MLALHCIVRFCLQKKNVVHFIELQRIRFYFVYEYTAVSCSERTRLIKNKTDAKEIMKILIAEDVRHTALQYKIALEDRNHQVFTTIDGEDCLRAYNEYHVNAKSGNPFDVVIVDYRIPKRDGLDLAKQIRIINPKQRILFASAYLKDALLDSLKELHGIEFIEKPFDLEELIEVVERK